MNLSKKGGEREERLQREKFNYPTCTYYCMHTSPTSHTYTYSRLPPTSYHLTHPLHTTLHMPTPHTYTYST